MQMREHTRMASLRRLEQLMTQHAELAVKPEFMIEFGFPGEKILQAANTLKVDAHHYGFASLNPSRYGLPHAVATAYEVVCGAGCPVLTVRY